MRVMHCLILVSRPRSGQKWTDLVKEKVLYFLLAAFPLSLFVLSPFFLFSY